MFSQSAQVSPVPPSAPHMPPLSIAKMDSGELHHTARTQCLCSGSMGRAANTWSRTGRRCSSRELVLAGNDLQAVAGPGSTYDGCAPIVYGSGACDLVIIIAGLDARVVSIGGRWWCGRAMASVELCRVSTGRESMLWIAVVDIHPLPVSS